MKIVFLDIDGVLLSTRAWLMPANWALQERARIEKHATRELVTQAVFDPGAVALINRLCARTGAKIVVHSNWRRNIGLDATRAKLIEQGLYPAHLHEAWSCGFRLSSEKAHDIFAWMSEHRLTPEPEHPDDLFKTTRAARRRAAAYYAALNDTGITAVVIDDEPIFRGREIPQVRTVFDEGFTLADYRVALGLLGGDDPTVGVHPIAADDLARVLTAFDGDPVAAWRWLTADPHRLRDLNREVSRTAIARENAGAWLYGLAPRDPETTAAKRRERVFADLPKPKWHRRPKPLSNDF